MKTLETPILFLIFNRPDTTAKVFERIKEAKPTKLYVAADGARPTKAEEKELCEETRRVASAVDWPCELITLYRDENLGCKQAVSSAISWFFDHEEAGIILEDDCLPHLDFFTFCDQMLKKYIDTPEVMMISGTNYLFDRHLNRQPSYYFSRYYAIWGWATWRRAWQQYDITMTKWPEYKKQQYLDWYFPANIVSFWNNLFDMAYNGQINTWDLQWVYTCMFNNGLALVPNGNMVSNIGLTGTHTSSSGDSEENEFINMPTYGLEAEKITHPNRISHDIELDKTAYQSILGKNFMVTNIMQKLSIQYRKFVK